MTIKTKAKKIEEIIVTNDEIDETMRVYVDSEGDLSFETDHDSFYVPALDVWEFYQALKDMVEGKKQ